MRPVQLFLLVCLLVCPFLQASAGTIYELNSGVAVGIIPGGEGTGRGIGFYADSTFSIDFVGIQADLTSKLYDILIYSSTDGHQAGSVLATASALRGGAGFGFYDIPISYTFVAGNNYVLSWRPADGAGWVGSTGLMYFNDEGLPITIGPLTLLDGTEGFTAESFSNAYHPNLRINTVDATIPEPAVSALVLFGLALLALKKRTA